MARTRQLTDGLKLFEAELKAKLWPLLRTQGFVGKGRTYRRVTDGVVIQLLDVQLDKYGGGAFVNLCHHLTFLPTLVKAPPGAPTKNVRGMPDPTTLTQPQCKFVVRLSENERQDQRWAYDADAAATVRSVDHLVQTYRTKGEAHFERHRAFPGNYERIGPAMLARDDRSLFPGNITLAGAAKVMAYVSIHRSLPALAIDFIAVGLADLRQHNTGQELRRDLVAMRASLRAAAS